MRRSVLTLTVLLAAANAFAQHVETHSADVIIRSGDDGVAVLLDTTLDTSAPSDGLIDQWFFLQTAEPPLTPILVHLPSALVIHTARALRVTTSDQRYEFVLDRTEGAVPPMTTRVAGIGLSHNTGAKMGRIGDQLDRRGRVTPACESCLTQDPSPGGGSGGTACPSGGPGSTSCSASYGTTSCDVTCASGYYACCQALPGAAYCRCVKGS